MTQRKRSDTDFVAEAFSKIKRSPVKCPKCGSTYLVKLSDFVYRCKECGHELTEEGN